MKNKISILVMGLAALFLCPNLRADSGHIAVDGFMPIPAAASYSSTFSVRTDGINWASGQVVVTSVTQPSQSFNDGTASTGNLTVVSYTALSTATATGKITVTNVNFLASKGGCVSGGGPAGTGQFNVCTPGDFAVTASTGATACALSNAINSYNVITTTCVVSSNSGIVYTTAAYAASVWNSFKINTTSNTTGGALLAVQMTGGQDKQSFSVNGKTFLANKDFYPVTSTAQTCTNIASAITKSSTTTTVAATCGASSVVFATSTVVGASANYAVTSSTDGALKLSGPKTVTGSASAGVMTGGTNASYAINTSTIALAGNNFGSGQSVYVSGTAVLPLVVGTTYYVITIPPGSTVSTNQIELATSRANALANTPIVLVSSAVKTTTDTTTLNPGAITGTPGIQWVVSNDNTNWLPYVLTPFNIAVSSMTYGSYSAAGTVNNFDLGHMDYGYLGLSVTAPTAGAVNIKAHVIGKE